jgi:hypothetical protein
LHGFHLANLRQIDIPVAVFDMSEPLDMPKAIASAKGNRRHQPLAAVGCFRQRQS